MNLPTIKQLIDKGYELVIRRYPYDSDRPYHARVYTVGASSHNYLGATIEGALEGLERYVEASQK